MNRIQFPDMKYPLVAILRGMTPEETPAAVGALLEAGFRAIEIPLNSPNPFQSIEIAAKMAPADALIGAATPFTFEPIAAGANADLGSHSLSPVSVLSLAATLYGKWPEAWILGISGHDFGAVKEGLSAVALGNLDLAEAFFVDWYEARDA